MMGSSPLQGGQLILTLMNSCTAIIFNIIIQYGIILVGVERALVIGAKTVLAPLIVPDIYHNGLNSSGIKFLKGLLGDYFQTTMVVLVIVMCCATGFGDVALLESGDVLGFVLLPGKTLIASLIAVVLLYSGLKKSRNYAQQIFMGIAD